MMSKLWAPCYESLENILSVNSNPPNQTMLQLTGANLILILGQQKDQILMGGDLERDVCKIG